MSKATFNGQFDDLNKQHDYSINCIKNILERKCTTFRVLDGKNNSGCDLMVVFKGESNKRHIEVKTNWGSHKQTGFVYNAWILETYADYDKTRLPEWRNSENWVDYLFIHNLYKNEIHVYDVRQLREYVRTHEYLQVSSGASVKTKSADNTKCSWGIKIPWQSEEAGWQHTYTVKGLHYGQTSNYNEPLYPTKHRSTESTSQV